MTNENEAPNSKYDNSSDFDTPKNLLKQMFGGVTLLLLFFC
jgi:hypothetical protein